MAQPFHNRPKAWRLLAKKARRLCQARDVLVLALPRGSVLVAFEAAKALQVPNEGGARSVRVYNQAAQRYGGLWLLTRRWPVNSSRLNPIEPHWIHGRPAIVELTRWRAEGLPAFCDEPRPRPAFIP
jgi:hypothetical protein